MLAARGALALIALAQTTAVDVQTAPNGGEVLSLGFDGPAWTEVRIALRTPTDPPQRPGLGAVAAEVLGQALRAHKRVAPTLRVTRTQEGVVVAFAVPRALAEPSITSALRTIAETSPSKATTRAAIDEIRRRRKIRLRSPSALARMQLREALLTQAFELGAPQALGAATPGEVREFLKQTVAQSRLSLILTGDVHGLDTESWPAILPSHTSSAAPVRLAHRHSPAALEVIVIDRPGLTHAQVLVGWLPHGVTFEAVPTIAAALFGPEARWQAPLLTLTQSTTVATEAEAVQSILQRMEGLANAVPSSSRWKVAQAHARSRLALDLRDASRAADALARDRVDPSRALSTVLDERLQALNEPPSNVGRLFRAERTVAVIVTSVDTTMVARLARLRPGTTVRVVAWDQL